MKRMRKILLFVIAALGCVAISALWWVVIEHRSAIGTSAKWLLRSHDYKAEVLAQPGTTNGELKHVGWDGWGWGGQDTVIYLVFDPTDSLSQAASSHQPGKYSGIPCEVFLVRRLESQWYTVWFYTNYDWRPNC
jgi:hypothetical protein